MSAARDVIARALVEVRDGFIAEHGHAALTISLGNFAYADGVLAALHAAGYRIVGPGEVDRETLSVAALTAWLRAKQGDTAGQISEAIEALGGKDA